MWESRPLPKIVRDPLAAHSARGSFLYGAPPHGASACPIPQRQDFPSAILPVGSLVVPGTGRGALAVGERCKESTAGRGERMPVWGDAHRFAGEKRGFPASVLMAGERKQEGWGVGWHRHGATALPAPILDTPQVMAVVASGGGWRGGGPIPSQPMSAEERKERKKAPKQNCFEAEGGSSGKGEKSRSRPKGQPLSSHILVPSEN